MGDINQFYAGLDSIFAEGRIREVEGYCLQWKEDAERGGDAQGVIAACNELGGFYRAQGKLPEAEVLYLRVLAELRRNGLDKTENYATALINLGTVHIVGQEIEKAYKVYQEAEEILTALGFWKDYRMAALNNSLSAVYREMGRLNDAENCSRKALDIIVDYPDKRGELATTYVNLGEVQTAQGKFEIA
ncbi:MAG: tetratricopeptide repeat protein, partial [Anaerovoracaceae bacterium]